MIELNTAYVNNLQIVNIVQYGNNVYSIYDMDPDLIYLRNNDKEDLGIPIFKVKPILLTDNVMSLCNFSMQSEPESILIGEDIIQVRTEYQITDDKLGIDMKINIFSNYSDDDPFLVNTFDKIDKPENTIRYLHQIQNIFRFYYNFELLTLE